MQRTAIIITVLGALSLAAVAYDLPEGNPSYNGHLEFVYPDLTLEVIVDGILLEPTDGLYSIIELSHGKHLLQIYRTTGRGEKKLLTEEDFEFPGGYITRITYAEDQLQVLDALPDPILPNQGSATQPSSTTMPTSTTTSETTDKGAGSTSLDPSSLKQDPKVSNTGKGLVDPSSKYDTHLKKGDTTYDVMMSQSASSITSSESMPSTGYSERSSKLTFVSRKGDCAIYLNGVLELNLNQGSDDKMVEDSLVDIKPGSYMLKVEGDETWYDGPLEVNPGEHIKISVEPGEMNIVTKLPY